MKHAVYLAGEAPMEFFEFQEVAMYEWAKKFGVLPSCFHFYV